MELQRQTVLKTLMGWNIRFPSSDRDEDQVAYLATEYFEDLSDTFSEEIFIEAAKLVRQRQKFFPTVAHLFEVRDEVIGILSRRKDDNQRRLALTETTGNLTPEEEQQNKEKVNIIQNMLAGKLSLDEALKKQERLVGYAASGNP